MVKQFVTATDRDALAERESLGFAGASLASVHLVTDKRTCGKARAAFNARQRAEGLIEVARVYVVRAGEGRHVRYMVKAVAQTPDLRSEFGASLVFDRGWRFKSAYGA